MSGVEIKPGVWINPDRIDQITEDINMGAWQDAFYQFSQRRRAYRNALENTTDGDLQLAEPIRPEIDDYRQVKILMANGQVYWMQTNLRSTLYVVGWLDG